MHDLMSCEKCGKVANPKDTIITKPDGSTWLHYQCREGHRFHRSLVLKPAQMADCDCSHEKRRATAPAPSARLIS
jgi:hypothetical protein